jgi:hypothetical protein
VRREMYSRSPISVVVRPSPTNDTMVCSDAVRLAQPWVARAAAGRTVVPRTASDSVPVEASRPARV